MTPHFLQRLGLLQAPEGTTLQGAELALRGGMPLWLAALFLVGGAALAVFFYRRETAKLGPARRFTLAFLRTLLIALVLLMLMRPVLLADYAGERPRGVIVLVDNSQSMTLADRRVSDADKLRVALAKGLIAPDAGLTDTTPLAKMEGLDRASRLDIVQAALGNEKLALLDRLGKKGPVQVVLFDRKPTPTGEEGLAALKADGTQTALADSVYELLSRQAHEPPAAIVIISDGRDTASTRTYDEVARACGEKGVPLHVWGVGSSEAGVLALKDVRVPGTVFIDEKPEVKDDPVEVPIRFRCRGFKKGTIEMTLKVGDETVTETMPVTEGENLTRVLKLVPKKGKDGERPVSVSIRLREQPDVGDSAQRVVQVKNSRIKVLYVENTPRREYKFIQPTLDRDRRVLLRLLLGEGDPRLAEMPADRESGAQYLDKFPENFPEPHPKDQDRRPYDLVILGDVPAKVLGDRGVKALRQFVKEGGGLVLLAGRMHSPAEYATSPLAEVWPVEFRREEFNEETDARATPFRPGLTYDGENSPLLMLDDNPEKNREMWAKELWENVPGFFWYYPVTDLRPGAVSLLVHPDRKAGKRPDEKPLPLVATQYYGKGEVLYVGVEETWRWRDNTGDKLTSRFWGQVVVQFGLPHLLGNARRSQLELERGEPVLGRPGAVKVRLLDAKYEPVIRPTVKATLVNLDAKDESARREVILQRVPGQPGEYRAALPNDAPGRHELRLPGSDGLEESTLPFRVDLPPRHELLEVGLAEESLRALAATSGGAFYREEDLHTLPERVAAAKQPFVQRAEVLLWGPLPLVLFILLITAEWIIRKFSNLS